MPRLAPPSSPPVVPGNEPAGRAEPSDEANTWRSRRVELLGDDALGDHDDEGASWFSALFGG